MHHLERKYFMTTTSDPHQNLQFKHANHSEYRSIADSFTFAVIPPDPAQLVSAARAKLGGEAVNISVQFGSTKLGKKDKYCKATGRQIAQSRLASSSFEVVNVHLSERKELHIVLRNATFEMTVAARLDKIHTRVVRVSERD